MPEMQVTAESPPSAETQRVLDEIEGVKREANDLVTGMSDEQFNWRSAPGRWSVGQCLEHLTLTVRLYLADFDRMLEEAKRRTGEGRSYRPGWMARWLIRSLEPPPGFKVKTMRAAEPGAFLPRAATVQEFMDAHDRLAEYARAANGLDPSSARMTSPFLRLMRLTMGQVFAVNTVHARRHLWQARQVRQNAAFPDV